MIISGYVFSHGRRGLAHQQAAWLDGGSPELRQLGD